jgi:SAM-dependent methyltransferase
MLDFLQNTLHFYSIQADNFADRTLSIDLSIHYKYFSKHVPSGHILDLGCGTGRDSKSFLERGYSVTAMDGAPEMIARTIKETDGRCNAYLTALYDELSFRDQFDAVWAMASLVHVGDEDIFRVLSRIKDALKEGGIGYISVKEGTGSAIDNDGRFFNFYNLEKFIPLFSKLEDIEIIEHFNTKSETKNINECVSWLNIIFKKKGNSFPLCCEPYFKVR